MQKILSIVMLLALLGLGVFLGASFYAQPVVENGGSEGEQIFCTLDAMVCPDGSAVGREGPNCEFAACPGEAKQNEFNSLIEEEISEIIASRPGVIEFNASSGKTYRNEEYGFELSLNSDWKDLKVLKDDKSSIFIFCLPTIENYASPQCGEDVFNGSALLFYLQVYTHDEWENKLAQGVGGITPRFKLGENDDYIFIYWTSNQELPSDLKLAGSKIKDILSTFTITK